jgi:hypothetical protein
MGHRLNQWFQRMLAPTCGLATIVFLHKGFSVGRTLAILLPVCGALMLVMVLMNPGPKTKGFVEGLKGRFH